MDFVREFEKEQTAALERPNLAAGDVVRVEMKVTEGEKTRLQVFEGVVLGIRGSGPSTTFTVRREIGRFAVERIFPLYNPLITKIEIVKRQKVRRAKLNYLRNAGRRRVKEDVVAMERHEADLAESEKMAAQKEDERTQQEAAAQEADEKKNEKSDEKSDE